MRPKHIFWGFLFITIGILILLNNFGSLNIDLYNYWKYWPLVLILLGVSFLLSNVWLRSFFAAVSGIILAFAIFSLFSTSFDFIGNRFVINDNGVHVDFDESMNDTTYYSEPYLSGIKSAELIFRAGAGKFRIQDTTFKLFEAVTYGFQDNYEMSTSTSDGNTVVNFDMKKRKIIINDKDNGNKAYIKLNILPAWDMNFKLGAASVDFDLTPYNVKNVNMDMGAAKVDVKLGNKSDTTNLNVDAGVSSITIDVPESSGCQINAQVSLSSKKFEGFSKTGGGYYRTNNFDKAQKKIFIKLKSGISSIKVYRYAAGW